MFSGNGVCAGVAYFTFLDVSAFSMGGLDFYFEILERTQIFIYVLRNYENILTDFGLSFLVISFLEEQL